MLRDFDGETDKLGNAERFYLLLTGLRYYSIRLDVMLLKVGYYSIRLDVMLLKVGDSAMFT